MPRRSSKATSAPARTPATAPAAGCRSPARRSARSPPRSHLHERGEEHGQRDQDEVFGAHCAAPRAATAPSWRCRAAVGCRRWIGARAIASRARRDTCRISARDPESQAPRHEDRVDLVTIAQPDQVPGQVDRGGRDALRRCAGPNRRPAAHRSEPASRRDRAPGDRPVVRPPARRHVTLLRVRAYGAIGAQTILGSTWFEGSVDGNELPPLQGHLEQVLSCSHIKQYTKARRSVLECSPPREAQGLHAAHRRNRPSAFWTGARRFASFDARLGEHQPPSPYRDICTLASRCGR